MLSRRAFLQSAAFYTAVFASPRGLAHKPRAAYLADGSTSGIGSPRPDPAALLDLTPGSSYVQFSRTGEDMDDGLLVPGMHNGMAASAGPEGRTFIVRNHELESASVNGSPFGHEAARLDRLDRRKLYDAVRCSAPNLGGTTTHVFNTHTQKLERHFLSLAGTVLNCAGGPTPWGTSISCEEVNAEPEPLAEKLRGYNFVVVPSAMPGLVDPVPLKAWDASVTRPSRSIPPQARCIKPITWTTVCSIVISRAVPANSLPAVACRRSFLSTSKPPILATGLPRPRPSRLASHCPLRVWIVKKMTAPRTTRARAEPPPSLRSSPAAKARGGATTPLASQ